MPPSGLHGQVVRLVEERSERTVARDLHGRAGRGLAAQDHRAVDLLVRRVDDVRLRGDGMRGPHREHDGDQDSRDRNAREPDPGSP